MSLRERLAQRQAALRNWFVVGMDDGIIRREKTKRPPWSGALGWLHPWVARGDAARRQGFKITQTPLYPHADKPYERVERTTEGTT